MKPSAWKMICLVILLLLAACASSPQPRADLLQSTGYPTNEYRIQPGDLLDIKLFYNPELNESLTVRPDGRITLQLVNEVVAAGLTPAELTAVLTKAFAGELANPKVAVILRTSVADRVYVDGEVTKAGLVPLTGPTTVLQAISQAGGLKDSAQAGEVILMRKGDDNKINSFRVDLGDRAQGNVQDVYLRPNDIVYVPKSGIANLNTWVDLYLRKNIPIPLGISF